MTDDIFIVKWQENDKNENGATGNNRSKWVNALFHSPFILCFAPEHCYTRQSKQNPCWFFIAYNVYLQHHPRACQEQSCRTKNSLHHQVLTSTFRPRGYIADLEGSLWCLLSENQSHSMRFASSLLLFSSALLSHKAPGLLWNTLSHTTGFSSV